MTRVAQAGRVLAAVAVVAVVVLAGAAGPTAAVDDGRPQATEANNSTATGGGEQAASGAQNDSSSEVVAQVDEQIRVQDYRFNNSSSEFVVVLENTGKTPTDVTLTEAIDPEGGGAASFGVEVVTVDAGETVTVRVDIHGETMEPGVMIVTPASVNQGTGTYLEVELEESGGGLLKGGATWGDVWAGILFAIAASCVVTALGVWYVVARESNEIEEVPV